MRKVAKEKTKKDRERRKWRGVSSKYLEEERQGR